MTKKKLILFLILIILSISIATTVIYFKSKIHQIRELPLMVEVTNKIGIGIYEGEQLNFGVVRRGGSRTMFFNITSNEDVKLTIFKKGDIADFIYIPENNFFLQTNELKRVSVDLRIPLNTELSNYSGKLIMVLRNV